MIDLITREVFQSVLEKREMKICFQPIVSTDKKRIIGCEALFRAGYKGEAISAESFFGYARKSGNVKKLDFVCREESMRSFQKMNTDCMLFLNFEASLLQEYLQRIEEGMELLREFEIQKEKVVIEINEKTVQDNDVLLQLVEEYRRRGFLFALDDVGEGQSNLNRIALVKPDIVKIDRMSIMDIDKNYYKQEILRAITGLASKIGAVVVAEGVEREEEIYTCLSLGVDLFQGFYFSRAVEAKNFKELDFREACTQLTHTFLVQMTEGLKSHAAAGLRQKQMVYEVAERLNGQKEEFYENLLSEFLLEQNDVECGYILDGDGRQVTRTIFNRLTKFKNVYLFSPAGKGDFHLLKPYYYVAMYQKTEVYVSEAYISAATGNFCKTYSLFFLDDQKKEKIVCLDLLI